MPIAKALAYVVRFAGSAPELLVFKHVEMPESGVQVPAGTIQQGESPAAAAQRELVEESEEHHRRHVFLYRVTEPLPDAWVHIVSAPGEDSGLSFRFGWMPLRAARHTLAADQGAYIPDVLPLLVP